MDSLVIGVLGPIEAHLDGQPICFGGRNERMVFAALVVALNHAVPNDSLIAALWGDEPPDSAIDTLQSIVSRLRHRLGRDAIESVDHSYCLVADPALVDSIRFERLLAEAGSHLDDDPGVTTTLVDEALGLWRGAPFGDLGDVEFLRPEVWRLEALRSGALELRLEADVATGRLKSAIAGLQAEILECPFRERLWYLLVLALARDGRRVDALRACQDLRRELGKVGLDPSADIRELEEMVLREAPEVRCHLRR